MSTLRPDLTYSIFQILTHEIFKQFNMLHLANNFNVNLMKVKFTLFKKY